MQPWRAQLRFTLIFGPFSLICAPFPEGGLPRSSKLHGRSVRGAVQEPSHPTVFRPSAAPPSTDGKDHMALYEHVLIARQDISAQQAEALNDQLKTLIEENGGAVAKIEYWGLRNLTYRIKKNRKGHYSLLAIDAPPPIVKEMERQLSINEDVLRYMTVRVEELDLELSPILARRDRERERERPRNPYEDVGA
jgi:small subunit ribosomal protein S6